MGKFIDLTGKRFGRLTVIERADDYISPNGVTAVKWKCLCDCGNVTEVRANDLRNGTIKSCGCSAHDRKKEDLTGRKFGNLTVVEWKGGDKWLCKCDCGNVKIVYSGHLKDGHIKSCGCLKNKYNAKNKRLLNIWKQMISRCDSGKRRDSKYYHDKGITVCPEWRDYKRFEEWALANGYADNLTIDRIDENGNYEPSNCQWITLGEQQRKKSGNNWVEYNGKRKIIADWAREYGINRATLESRLEMGYTFEEALKKKPGRNRVSVIVNYKGEEMTITQLSRKLGVSKTMISKDLRMGKTKEEAIRHAEEVGKKHLEVSKDGLKVEEMP